jgi:hypothetical protein
MNMLMTVAMPHGLVGILIGFLVIVIAIAVLAGLIYMVETYIMKQPLPTLVRLIIGLVVLVILIIWLVNAIGVAA